MLLIFEASTVPACTPVRIQRYWRYKYKKNRIMHERRCAIALEPDVSGTSNPLTVIGNEFQNEMSCFSDTVILHFGTQNFKCSFLGDQIHESAHNYSAVTVSSGALNSQLRSFLRYQRSRQAVLLVSQSID